MPELPEVETARRFADRLMRGRRIVAVATVPDSIVYEGVSPARFAAALRGRRVEAVRRKGKHLWLELDRRPWPLFHFGMTGWFEVYERERDRPRFWKVELLELEGGEHAVGLHRGPYDRLHESYRWLFGQWLPSSGREPANRAVHEIYVNDPRTTPPADLVTHVCIPLVAAPHYS